MYHMRGMSTRRYVRMPWGQVHLREAGRAGDPVVVMLHQSPLSSATMEAVLQPLARAGLHAVALDTPGFGMSDATPRPWTIPDYAAAMWQTLDELGLKRVALLGQHTGAIMAWEATAQRPGAVTGLVLQGLPLYDDVERARKHQSYAPGYDPQLDGSHLQVIWQRVRGLYPALTAEEINRQVLEYLSTGPDYATAYRAVFDYVVRPEALRGHPMVLLHGDADLVHRFTPVVTTALPWAAVDLIEGGTDFVADEQPEAFAAALARAVLQFLDARESL